MDELECPYCFDYSEPCPDNHETGEKHIHECENCHKKFTYEIEYSADYTSEVAPCLNNEAKHDLEIIYADPSGLHKTHCRCKGCGQRIIFKPGEYAKYVE